MATHLDDARQAFQARFKTQWEAAQPTIPVRWPNIRWDPPDGTAWVSFDWGDQNRTQATTGSATPVIRTVGNIIVTVFTPMRTGDGQSWELADVVDGIFRRQEFSQGQSGDIVCKVPTIYSPMDDGTGWLMQPIFVGYWIHAVEGVG